VNIKYHFMSLAEYIIFSPARRTFSTYNIPINEIWL